MSSPAVAVTRPSSDDDRLVAALERRGLRSVCFPLQEILGPEDPIATVAAMGRSQDYDLVAFTSRNAVSGLAALLDREAGHRDTDHEAASRPGGSEGSNTSRSSDVLAGFLRGSSVVAVGEGTAGALRARGVAVEVVPSRGDAAALVAAITARRPIDGCRVLLPCGDLSRPTLQEQLTERGARTTQAVVYRTVDGAPSVSEALERALLGGEISVVTFGSGSAVQAFERALSAGRARAALYRARVACLGASASDALRSLGVVEAAVAESSSFGALADAVQRLLP